MLTVSESLHMFLTGQKNSRNSDLLDRVLKHGTDLEIQINVSAKGGELVDGTTSTYTDGINRWHSSRIPKDSFSEPHWKDYTLRFPLDKYVDSIGSTGWLWARRESLWCAFDFDSLTGHAEGVGITDRELARVRDTVSAVDYVEVRRSTGGNGLHLYVFAPPGTKTANHHEHAAVARAILSKLSEEVGFDLCQNVDACGTNTWIWSIRSTEENRGFELLKPATCNYPYDLGNWRDHLDVVNRSRPKVSIGANLKEQSLFDQLTSGSTRVTLQPEHIAVRDALADLGCSIWVNDYHLLQTHTCLLKRLKDHGPVEIKGVFETTSRGRTRTNLTVLCTLLATVAFECTALVRELLNIAHGTKTASLGPHATLTAPPNSRPLPVLLVAYPPRARVMSLQHSSKLPIAST